MTKREYVIKLLNWLIDDREIAKPLLVLVENGVLNDDAISSICDIFRNALNNTMDKVKKEKLQKSIWYLEKIRQMETEYTKDNENDLLDLENEIMNL